MTKKDWILIIVILLSGIIIGGAIFYRKPQPVTDTTKYDAIYKQIDSLKQATNILTKHIDTLKSRVIVTDAAIGNNLKSIANEIKVIKKFTPTSRSRYLDSLLATQ